MRQHPRTEDLGISSGTPRLIDTYLPKYDYTERHHLDIPAGRSDTYDAARHLDFSDSRITQRLFALRGIHLGSLTIDEMISGDSFKLLDELPPTEFVIGLAGTGAMPQQLEDGDHFISLDMPQGVKIAWSFHTETLSKEPGHTEWTRLHTETRTACSGRFTKVAFAAYWTVIKPFSGLIRNEMLKQARHQALSASKVASIGPT